MLAAAQDIGDLATLARTAAGLGLDLDGLAAAEQAGLVRLAAGRFEFRHPLVRLAIYNAARRRNDAPRTGRSRPSFPTGIPELQARLEAGIEVADVGCGAGRAVIELARPFPRSRFAGFDAHEGQIERARRNAAAGVDERVPFELLDAAQGLPEQFDLVTTFDVVHDAVDPLGLLRAIRNATRPTGHT